jgi:hypothetical protein
MENTLHARWGPSAVLLYIEEAPTHMRATLSVEATSSPTRQTRLKRLTVVKDRSQQEVPFQRCQLRDQQRVLS